MPPDIEAFSANLVRLDTGADHAWLSVWESDGDAVYFAGGNRSTEGGRIGRLAEGRLTMETIPVGPLLWWIHGLKNGDIWAVGEGGRILRRRDGQWTETPSGLDEKAVLWGIWGTADGPLWAVGGSVRRGGPLGIILRSDDHETWQPIQPIATPLDVNIYKVWGTESGATYFVGEAGTILHLVGDDFSQHDVPMRDLLFTVHGQASGPVIAVGGMSEGQVFELREDQWIKVVDNLPFGLNGVSTAQDGRALAVGARGTMLLRRADGAWYPVTVDRVSGSSREGLHGALMGRDIWAVGGDLDEMTNGFILTSHYPTPEVGF